MPADGGYCGSVVSAVRVAIVGAGWAACAAAVQATRSGCEVTLFEASRTAGGRARRVDVTLNGQPLALDNGQHILIGAYSETLKLTAELGVDTSTSLLRMPLTLQFPDGDGLRFPNWPAPLDALWAILSARGWHWRDKLAMLKASLQWQRSQFQCPPQQSVAQLCSSLSERVMATLIEPLCVSALNTPAERASGQVFLRVMQDALFSAHGASNLLLPRVDLGALLPDAALAWLQGQGGEVRLGTRVQAIGRTASGWTLRGDAESELGEFEHVILACPPGEAARLVQACALPCGAWLDEARGLQHEAIATIYMTVAATSPPLRLSQPMLALRASSEQPAQFVFDRAQLGGPSGLLAFVVSASSGDSASLGRQVMAQAAQQLGRHDLLHLQTIVEKRATFACSPGLKRPGTRIAAGLLACGDYIDGPYPATLEGAVRSGLEAARQLTLSQ